jgi:peptidoglycan hydrolase-like protein with peptidoglycan-binding domain
LEPSKEKNELKVAEVQQILRDAEFFPNGKVDGICGYRTRSAIRLFQEYVRTIEKDESMIPDGVVGPKSFAHLQRRRTIICRLGRHVSSLEQRLRQRRSNRISNLAGVLKQSQTILPGNQQDADGHHYLILPIR